MKDTGPITTTVAVMAIVIGTLSMSLFGVFMVWGPLSPVDLDIDDHQALFVDALLSFVFFVQHSVMIRRSFRERLARSLPPRLHGAVYAIASGAALFLVVLLWQESEHVILELQGTGRWLLRLLVPAALFIVAAGVHALRHFDALGVGALLSGRQPETALPTPLAAAGPYRWVRHPLYLAVIMVIWANPTLTADRLLFNALWTAWVVAATALEERDLAAVFGDSYRDYRRNVPMLVPWRFPRR